MKKMSKIVSVLLASAMALSMTACGSGSDTAVDENEAATEAAASSSTVSGDKLVWATNAEFEPYEYKEGDKVVGIDADLADAIAAKLGKTAEVMDIAFDSVIPSVTSKKADVGMAGITITEDRKQSVLFSDPYYVASQVIIVPKGSDIKSADDLKNKTIGVQLGTTGDTYCTDNIEGAKMERMQKGAEAVQSLLTGRIDAVVIDNEPATKFVELNADKIEIVGEPLTQESYAIAIAKDNEALLTDVNKALAELKESGELDAIINKYLGDDEESSEASSESASEAASEDASAALVEETTKAA